MATFTFENGYQRVGKQTPKTRSVRTNTKRIFSAPCACFDLDLECFHKVKERSVSISDSIIPDSDTITPEWKRYHAIERNQNTQRHKAG